MRRRKSRKPPLSWRSYLAGAADRARYLAQLRSNPRRREAMDTLLENARRRFPNSALPAEELMALHHYTDEGFRLINAVLRNDHALLTQWAGRWNAQAEPGEPGVSVAELMHEARWDARLVTSCLNRLPPHAETVFRKATLTARQVQHYRAEAVISEPAFLSASRDAFWTGRGDTLFVIESDEGRDVSAYSAHPDEREVLFRPATRFEVLNVEQTRENATWIYLSETA